MKVKLFATLLLGSSGRMFHLLVHRQWNEKHKDRLKIICLGCGRKGHHWEKERENLEELKKPAGGARCSMPQGTYSKVNGAYLGHVDIWQRVCWRPVFFGEAPHVCHMVVLRRIGYVRLLEARWRSDVTPTCYVLCYATGYSYLVIKRISTSRYKYDLPY